jgi:hypothetical protein
VHLKVKLRVLYQRLLSLLAKDLALLIEPVSRLVVKVYNHIRLFLIVLVSNTLVLLLLFSDLCQ